MEAYATVLSLAIPGFFVLIVIEAIAAKYQGLKINRSLDFISSISSGMTNILRDLMGLTIVLISYGWMETRIGIFDIQSTIPLYILAFIGLDFAGYWSHRFDHVINLFWNRHIIHHSSEEFNLACALRQSVSDVIGIYFFLYIPLALIGVPQQVVAVVAPIHLFAQFWYHTRTIDKMGFLEFFLVTPSHHRVHHAINAEYIDKNYSQIFIVWDRWFGTFQEELPDVPPVYGIKRPANTWNPFLINFMHLWTLIKDAWHTKSWRDKARIWFMPTGWRPEDVKEKLPLNVIDDVYSQKKYESNPTIPLVSISWFHFIVNTVLIYFLLVTIADFSIFELIYYGAFIMVSIFAYTSLMDRHILGLVFEVIKIGFAFVLIRVQGSWFDIDATVSYGTNLFIAYLMISLISTIYILFLEKKGKKNLIIET